MTTFTINNKEYTHKELNLLWDFFTEDQWDLILSSLDSFKDDDNEPNESLVSKKKISND